MDILLGEVLSTGADTTVVAGIDRSTGVPLAVKLPRASPPAPRTLDKLRHEHAMLSELAPLGGVRALGLVPHERGLMLAMERWGEASLDHVLARGPLPALTALRLGAALARALGQVHRRGVIHRDVKPQNVLVDAAQREVRLIDFGIATRGPTRAREDSAAESLSGTLAYMAPEQTGRMRLAVDARSDLYALGASLYQMLTGVLPFRATDAMELIHAHIARSPEPPHKVAKAQRVPEAVSAIVLKLMEKNPERRYQTAEGVAFDLERASEALATTGDVAPFPLGSRDWEDRVRKPSRLVGREGELTALSAALERVSRGAVVLAPVVGPSGVGKSALVLALREQVRDLGASFALGKFDQLKRGSAYEALAQALRSVVRGRLTQAADRLARDQAAWREAAGPNARVLIDLVPELAHVLGDPKALPEVGPALAKIRLQKTVQRFIRATSTAEHPLVVFIDDLQWADAPSLDLLREIVTDPDAAFLLLIAAYRDDEVDEAHPLHALAAAAAERGRARSALTVAPLSGEALESLVGDLLDQPPSELTELSALVRAKTDGSPFFVEQFLRALHERGLLARDRATGRFRWDAERIERAGVTDNVVALLEAKIAALPAASRRALALCACVGPSFEAALVGAASAMPEAELRGVIDDLAREGLIVPAEDGEGESYAFAHDRVQQAAYASLDEAARTAAHFALGRELERRGAWESRDEALFAMLYHVLRSLPRLEATENKRRAASALLRGGARAKAASAYAQAAAFLKAGRALLGEDGFEEAFELTFDTQLALAEASWLAGAPEVGESLFQDCKARARSLEQRGRAAVAWLELLHIAGRYQEGKEIALEALAARGVPFPREPHGQQALFADLLGRITPKLQATSLEAWRALPRCADPAEALTGALLGNAITVVGTLEPALFPPMVFTLVDHTFNHGFSPGSASAMGTAMIVFISALQQLELAAKCGELVFAMRSIPDLPKAAGTYAAWVAGVFVLPIDRILERWSEVLELCEREGDLTHGDYAQSILPLEHLLRGTPLAAIQFPTRPLRTTMAQEFVPVGQAIVAALRGETNEGYKAAVEGILAQPSTSPVNNIFRLAAASLVSLHLGEDAETLRLSAQAEPLWMNAFCGPVTIYNLLTFTVLGSIDPPAEGPEAEARRAKVAFHRARFAKLAAVNPGTFRHMELLVEASVARAEGRHDEAQRLYDEAIADAHAHGFQGIEALGLRLCAEHNLARGQTRVARALLREAHEAYLRWGAHGAAARLCARYPDTFPAPRAIAPARGASPARAQVTLTTSATATTQESSLNVRLDASSVLRAAQALSSDMVLSSLLGRMLRVLAENAGAERAVLAIAQGDALKVRAELSLNPEQLTADLDEQVRSSARLPATLAQYAARSREPVAFSHGASDGRFDHDPYLRAQRPASALAVPLLRKGRLLGVIYLEHPRAYGAFPEAQVETIALLAAQAATAVENATLYAELAASNERLEHQVKERTAQLSAAKQAADAANQAKSDFLASMSHELRTPLNGILGYAQILARSASISGPEREGVGVIRRSGEHLLTLINDVLDLARIEAGKLELAPKDVHLPTLLRTVSGMCRVRADEKGLAFDYALNGPTLPAVRVDEKRLLQVLINLIGNAVKFTERGRVRLLVEVQEGPATTANGSAEYAVRFRVEDTGPGIAPPALARIFEPFEQAGDAKARAEGSGLGLSITRRIVERMGGRIEVESVPGEGSAFSFTLALPEAAAVVAAPSWESITGYLGERRAVLVVDDNAENRAVLRDLLAPLGFTLLEAGSGEQALALARAHRPALVLMDLAMPDMDGHEATRRLRQLPELGRLIIIAASASASEAEQRQSAASGCDDFLPKPVRAEELLQKLERHLGLTWVRSSAEVPSIGRDVSWESAAGLARPPEAMLAPLAELAEAGRIRNLLEETHRLEARGDAFAPFFAHARGLAQRFQMKALRALLRRAGP